MKCIDHDEAVGVDVEDLDRDLVAIVGQFFEPGYLGRTVVFCHVSVPDRFVEAIEKETGWKKISSNTFSADMNKYQVRAALEKIQPIG